MEKNKQNCFHQGKGKMNPIRIGNYDIVRETNDKTNPNYYITSDESNLYDAGINEGKGGFTSFYDLVSISKGAVSNDCNTLINLDIKIKPAYFNYYPSHPVDVIFVLDVTSSMMNNGSHKFTQAKRALIQAIELLWKYDKNTTVTIIPYGKDAMIPLEDGGFDFDYLGTMFTWKRATDTGHRIGQILGYRNNSSIPITTMYEFLNQSKTKSDDVDLSLYSFYKYYKIKYKDIYNDDGSPKTDTILTSYIQNIYSQDKIKYQNSHMHYVANGLPLNPTDLTYSMNDNDYKNNTILENAVWAIPYSEDTNTESGLNAAFNLLIKPGFCQSNDIQRRFVVLITDGQANRSLNQDWSKNFPKIGDNDSDYMPSSSLDPWKYFMYLLKTYPTLCSEINNRSSTSSELIRAMQMAYQKAEDIKNPEKGNAILFVLGIDIGAQTPGPYTKKDVIEIMKTIATTGKFLHEASENETINEVMIHLFEIVNNMLTIIAGLKINLHDKINTALFEYEKGSLTIKGSQDNIKLKMKNAVDITDPTDSMYTVYKKPALLPDVSDVNFDNGTLSIDFGIMPFLIPDKNSETNISISYNINNKGCAIGNHLHTNWDNETYVRFIEPEHFLGSSPTISYDKTPIDLFFHTPIIQCTPDITIKKYVGCNDKDITCKNVKVASLSVVYYKVVLTNHTNNSIEIPLVIDVFGVNNIEEALLKKEFNVLGANITIHPHEAKEFIYSEIIKKHHTINNFAIIKINDKIYYDSAVVTIN